MLLRCGYWECTALTLCGSTDTNKWKGLTLLRYLTNLYYANIHFHLKCHRNSPFFCSPPANGGHKKPMVFTQHSLMCGGLCGVFWRWRKSSTGHPLRPENAQTDTYASLAVKSLKRRKVYTSVVSNGWTVFWGYSSALRHISATWLRQII